MKYKIILIITLLLPITIKAEENIQLNCPENTIPNQKIECRLNTNDIKLKGLKFNIALSENITYKETNLSSNWIKYYDTNKGLLITNPNNTDALSSIMNFNITKNAIPHEKATITLSNIEASNENHRLLTFNNITKEINILSNDNSLSSLTVLNEKLTPTFNKNIYTYTVKTIKQEATINAVTTDKNAKLAGNIGKQNLNYGTNNYKLIVTSEYGTSKTYNIIIIRRNKQTTTSKVQESKKTNPKQEQKTITNNKEEQKITKESDSSLKNITIENYKIDFKPDKYLYKLKVSKKETTINITAIPSDKDATVKIEKPDTLTEGNNIITITVTTKDNTISKYTIIVNKPKEKVKETKKSKQHNIKGNILVNNILIRYTLYIIIFLLLLTSAIIINIKSKKNKEN